MLAISVHVLVTAAQSIVTDVNVSAGSVGALTPIVQTFRDALGDLNPNDPVNGDPHGRRQINWDAAPDFIADPNVFPGDFFNFNQAPRARGIEFSPVGSTSAFALSATAASGQGVNFGSPDFLPFSPERIFAPVDGTTFDVKFFDPADPDEPATSRGLGVVFVDVDSLGSATMIFFDVEDKVLATRLVSTGNFSFTGLIFNEAVVAKVRITSGNGHFLAANSANGTTTVGPVYIANVDEVAMDDFIFGEPIPIKEECGFHCTLTDFLFCF